MSAQTASRPRMVPLTFAAPEDLAERLRVLAEADDTSVSHIIRRIVKSGLAKESTTAISQDEVSE